MKARAAVLAAAALAGLFPAFAEGPGALTLAEAYKKTLAVNEDVAIQGDVLEQMEDRYKQLRSAVLPLVGFKATAFWQDDSGVPSGSSNTFTRNYRPEEAFYFHQPIFAGFRDWAVLKSQKTLRGVREDDLAWARLELFQDVAAVYYTVLQMDQRLEGLRTVAKLTDDRVVDLGRRVRIGRSRQSELLSTRSQRATIEAQEKNAEGLRAAALEILGSMMGEPVAAVASAPPDPPPPAPLEDYLVKLPLRPDLLAAAKNVDVTRLLATAKQREIWPVIGLSGNYYTKRTGSNVPIDWDTTLSLDFPIFRSGEWHYGVRAAKWEVKIADLDLARRRRLAERDIRTRHSNLTSLVAEQVALKNASELAEANYKAQLNDYKLGLVSNLDVLAALNVWRQAKLDYDDRRLQVALNALRLRAAVGVLPEDIKP